MLNGFFDIHFRLEQLDKFGDPLVKLNEVVPWESFRVELESIRDKERKNSAGRKPFDVVVMFKILILQSLYNLSDDAVEYQIRDRLSFMRFLGFSLDTTVPDAKTVWLFREQLAQHGFGPRLFDRFDGYLRAHGFAARKGQIVDASIIAAPKQRNTRDENEQIKNGNPPDDWSDAKQRQKDIDARWTQKNGKNYYGYKNHIAIDVQHKFIRDYRVTSAAVHDSQVLEELLDKTNSNRNVYADFAYRSEASEARLEQLGYCPHLQRKGCKNRKLTDWEKQGNHTRSKIRSRIEHVFGIQMQKAGTLLLRTIGIVRAEIKIGLRNLAFNMHRLGVLAANG